jgi:AbiV family abortive infection protein
VPKKKLQQYKGPLSPAQIAEGMNAAAANARRLYEDAATLLDGKRYPTALSLAVLSIEESGKCSILRMLSMGRNEQDRQNAWRDYRSHIAKNVMWVFLDLFKKGARGLWDFLPMFDDTGEHTYLLDQIKQLGFYTDCLGSAHWSVPDKVVSADLAAGIVKIAELLLAKRQVTPREIELWARHMRGIWGQAKETAEAAVLSWHRDMYAEGLTEDDPSIAERFFLGRLFTHDTQEGELQCP